MSKEISESDSASIKKNLGLPNESKLQLVDNKDVKTPTPLPPHMKGANENANPNQPQFEIHTSPDIGAFFAKHNVSLFATAYKSNTVYTFGATDDLRLGCFYATFPHPMAIGLSTRKDCNEVWIACQNHLVRCSEANSMYNEGNASSGGGGNFTSTYVPRQLHAIGRQDVHGVYPLEPNAPWYVSTKYSALCKLDMTKPEVTVNAVWKPPFISEIRGEDRCHFNDVCWVNGIAKYATCICESDAHDGWRDHRQSGGVIIDITKNEIIARNLSMPHSPRWYKNELWLLNSGTGYLGVVDVTTGEFTPKVFIPGFLRGLQFIGRHALVGSSLDRHERRFQDLDLGKNLETKKTSPVCGIFIVDLASLTISNKIEIKGNIHEIYDIALIPGRRARIVGINDEESTTWSSVQENFVKPVPVPVQQDDDENEEEEK